MSVLKIPYLKELPLENPALIAERLVQSGAKINIDKINWSDFPIQVETAAWSGYSDNYLWILYSVKNERLRAVCRIDQEPVWQDSCVEFFIRQGKNYRNFEFNCLGVCLSAVGPDRHGRKSLDADNLIQILRYPSLNLESLPDDGSPANWSLTVAIPLDLIGLKRGDEFYANFYKCGDETLSPHYISWSPIATPSPDFHCPGYFAQVVLVE